MDVVDSSHEVVSSSIPVYNVPIVNEPSQHRTEIVRMASSSIHDIPDSANNSGSTPDHFNVSTSVSDDKIRYVPQSSALVLEQSRFYVVLRSYMNPGADLPSVGPSYLPTVRYTLDESSHDLIPHEVVPQAVTCESVNAYIRNNVHPMTTRSKSMFVTALTATIKTNVDDVDAEPKDIYAAMKSTKWASTVEEELKVLALNNTWCLTTLPDGRIPVGCKWLFKVKRNVDGSIDRYKARLVAKGFSKKLGFDFQYTFTPVVKAPTIRIVLTLTLTHKWTRTSRCQQRVSSWRTK